MCGTGPVHLPNGQFVWVHSILTAGVCVYRSGIQEAEASSCGHSAVYVEAGYSQTPGP